MKPSLPSLIVGLLAATVAFGGGGSGAPRHASPKRAASKRPLPPSRRPPCHPAAKRGAVPHARPMKRSPRAAGRSEPPGLASEVGGVPSDGKMCAAVGVPQTCGCVGGCDCGPGCWCQSTHGPGTTGSSSGGTGTTSGSTGATSGGETDGGTSAGSTATAGGTAGSTSGSTGTTGTDTGGGTSSGGTSSGGTDAGSNGGYTGGSTGGLTGGSANGGAIPAWEASGDTPVLEGPAGTNLISGTNVNVSCTFRIGQKASPPDTSKTAKLTSIDVRIGGEADSTITQTFGSASPPASSDPQSYTLKVRFASTRFTDGVHVKIDATAHYRIDSTQGGTSPTVDVRSPALDLVVYNKGLALKTKQIADSATGKYKTVDPPPVGEYNWDAVHAIDESGGAVDQLVAMRHTIVNGDTVLKKAQILAGLKVATAFFAYTHGNPDSSFQASWGDYSPNPNNPYDSMAVSFGAPALTSEVGQAAVQQHGVPPINLAIFHACSLSTNGVNLGIALGISLLGQTSSTNGRAGSGFPEASLLRKRVKAAPSRTSKP